MNVQRVVKTAGERVGVVAASLVCLLLAPLTGEPQTGSAVSWLDQDGRANAAARQAIGILESAADEGLEPRDYEVERLRQLVGQLEAGPSGENASRFEAAMQSNMARFLRHLRHGRIDPASLGVRLPGATATDDVETRLRAAIDNGRLAELVESTRPPGPQYAALRVALARYRVLASQPPFQTLASPVEAIHPGDRYEDAVPLRAQLEALGDLSGPPSVAKQDDTYTPSLVEGVKRFQRRHGLDEDGVIGRATWNALSVTPAARLRQIELAMERQRWLHLSDEALIMLNIPMFRLWTWDRALTGSPLQSMKAIVGRARLTETPFLRRDVESVIVRPYWNVPRSILRKEILPILRKDLDYLRRQDMELVRGESDNGAVVEATPDALALLEKGALRLRQRAGPRNALGLLKLNLPNEEQVYLHGTPETRLFARSRRDFSHGCVRVEDPVSLAEWVLANQPDWNRERILSAMADATHDSRRIPVTRPVQVLLFYTTAMVMPEDGSLRFADDIYGRDAVLDRALSNRRLSVAR